MLNKKAKWWLMATVALLLMIATVPLAIWVTHSQSAQLENTQRRCDGKHQTIHKVVIENDRVTPSHTDAKQCDTLVITNLDDKDRVMAFGKHESHVSYDGISERLLSQGQSLTVTLGQAGTFPFHDHAQESVQGTFTVIRPQ